MRPAGDVPVAHPDAQADSLKLPILHVDQASSPLPGYSVVVTGIAGGRCSRAPS